MTLRLMGEVKVAIKQQWQWPKECIFLVFSVAYTSSSTSLGVGWAPRDLHKWETRNMKMNRNAFLWTCISHSSKPSLLKTEHTVCLCFRGKNLSALRTYILLSFAFGHVKNPTKSSPVIQNYLQSMIRKKFLVLWYLILFCETWM